MGGLASGRSTSVLAYKRRVMRLWVSWLLVVLLAACGGGDDTSDTWTRCVESIEGEAGAAAVPGLEVELGTVEPVIPVAAQGQTLLIYELSILNSSDAEVELVRVGATSGETIAAAYEGGTLRSRVSSGSTQIEAGCEVFVFMWLQVPHDVANQGVTNVVTMRTGGGDGQEVERRLEIPIIDEAPLVLGPPLSGDRWLAGNSTDSSPHSRNIEQFDGVPRIPLRFAIDWLGLGPNGDVYSGDFANNADHHAYGADVLAVADGTIEAVTDGVPENVPGDTRAIPITLDTRGGNLVILDIGNGRYVTYAHLIPGSLTVQVGDHVKRGDVLGKLGNSGNSSAPHLHFHVSEIVDRQNASGLNGNGLPFVFESFEILDDGPHAGVRMLETPIEDATIGFP
jgi:murein DD-endopeptidase